MTLQDCYCSSARRAARTLTARYGAALAAHGLSVPQFEVLAVLHAGACSGRSIAQRIGLDAATVSRNLKPMLQRRLVQCAADKSDGRQLQYGLTSLGMAALRDAMADWRAVQQHTAKGLPAESLDVLHMIAESATQT